MKVFINKGILFKLIVCLCIFLTLFNFTGTMQVYAAEQAEQASTGGKLLTPVLDLVMTLGDGIMNLIQKAIMGTPATNIIDISVGVWQVIAGILAVIVGALVIVGAIVISTLIPPLGAVAAAVVGGLLTTGAAVLSVVAGGLTYYAVYSAAEATVLPDYSVIPTIAVSPQEIFEGDLLIFDINFFTPKQIMVAAYPEGGNSDNITRRMSLEEWNENNNNGYINQNGLEASYYYYYNSSGEEIKTSKQSSSASLSRIISNWYYTIRNISIVVLMLILIYVGIRMLLTSIASEKTKYKKMLGDWVIAICLVFVLHYIMVFAVNINENIISIMKSINEQNLYTHVIKLDKSNNKSKNLAKGLVEAGFTEFIMDESGNPVPSDTDKNNVVERAGNGMVVIPTNLMGQTRLMSQKLDGTSEYVGYAIAYVILVFYTIFFAFTYLKRVLMMAFLTVIAPLVAITYPIDKISDGHAQAFNTWLKEYIFNLLIQPVHLLLYVLLISMAFELAGENIIYTLVAIGFMIPAEKFIRSMFGFDKAKTPGFLAGATGAALTMGAIQGLANIGKKIPHGQHNLISNKNGDNNNKDDVKGIYSRSANSGNGFESLLGTGDSNLQDDSTETKLNIGNQQLDNQNNGPDNLVNNPNDQNGPMDADLQDDPLDRGNQKLTDEEQLEYDALNDELANIDYNEMYLNPELYEGKQARLDELQQKKDNPTNQPTPNGRRLNTGNAIRLNETNANPVITMNDIEDVENAMNGGSRTELNENQIDPAEARQKRLEELKNKHRKRDTIKGVLKNPGVWRNALGKTIETSGKIIGGATGATIGLASGIASGDINNVIKNTAVGATSGTILSGAVSGGVADIVDGTTGSNMRSSFNRRRDEGLKRRYGADASEVKKLEQDEKFKKDSDARKFYATEFAEDLKGLKGKEREEKLDNIMEDAIKYREYGVTDNEKIIKAMNLDKNNRTSNTSIASALMATKATDLKGIESYKERLSKQVGSSQAEKIAEGAMKINGIGFTGGARTRLDSAQQQTQQQAQRTQQRQQQSQGSAQRQQTRRPRTINRTQPQNPNQNQNSPHIRIQPPTSEQNNN